MFGDSSFLKVQPPGISAADSTTLDSLTNEPDQQTSTRKRFAVDHITRLLLVRPLIFFFFKFRIRRCCCSSIHPPPAFGSSPNLEALALVATISHDEEGDNSVPNNSRYLLVRSYGNAIYSGSFKIHMLTEMQALA